jgi:NADH-quinone oxidoreductase subunit C
METLEQIRDRLVARFPSAQVSLVTNPGAAAEHSLQLDAAHAHDLALFLRDDPALQLDYCSNVTGIDWPDKEITDVTKTTVPDPAGGPPKIVESKTTRLQPGCLEVVYHLYSMALKHGPVVIRMRTANRSDAVALPSLTPVWRSCDFQEREVYDLYGIIFERHPDLRRILMWDEFKDYPMRKDYVEPDDYEWEPTAHGAVLERAKANTATVAGVADPGQPAGAGSKVGPGSATPATKSPEAAP